MKYLIALLTFVFLTVGGISNAKAEMQKVVFAGGCFWCLEHDLEKVEGVSEAVSGYAGGTVENPTYKQVSSGTTGHYEVVQVIYDPEVITYAQLLDKFWVNVEPTDGGGQFCDRGQQYESAIFAQGENKRLAEKSKNILAGKLGKTIETEILPLATFYPAEEYHQDYADKNAVRYNFYRWNCGRDQRLEEVWGK